MKLNGHEQFLLNAYAGLVLRGYNKATEIDDPILRDVWRRGKWLAKSVKAKGSRRNKSV